jgi:hypothetical protein
VFTSPPRDITLHQVKANISSKFDMDEDIAALVRTVYLNPGLARLTGPLGH